MTGLTIDRNMMILALIIVALAGGIFTTQFFSSPGVQVSCDEAEIVEPATFKKTPPSVYNVVAAEYCDVELKVRQVDSESYICEKDSTIRNQETGVVSCKNLNEYLDEEVVIQATFYEPNKPKEEEYRIGSDTLRKKYEGIEE